MYLIRDMKDHHTFQPKPDHKDKDAYMVEYILPVTQHNYQK